MVMRQITRRIKDDAAEHTRSLWEISYEGRCPSFYGSGERAATALVNILTRRKSKGWPPRILTVRLIDSEDATIWDATADIGSVLAATGWPDCDDAEREATISVLSAVLVEEH